MRTASGRMRRIDVAPEHVLHPIGAVKNDDAQAARHLVERIEEHHFALVIDVHALPRKTLVACGTCSFTAQVSSAKPSVANGPCFLVR